MHGVDELGDVTLLLQCWSRGHCSTCDRFVPLVNDGLRRHAGVRRRVAQAAFDDRIEMDRGERTPHLTRLPAIDPSRRHWSFPEVGLRAAHDGCVHRGALGVSLHATTAPASTAARRSEPGWGTCFYRVVREERVQLR
jgi:hypothetical protein